MYKRQTYNYALIYKLVFKSRESVGLSILKYAVLAVIQMALSALVTTLLTRLFANMSETIIKCAVDLILFFVSYFVQQRYVFSKIRK